MKIIAKGCGGLSGQPERYEVDTATLANGASIEALLGSLEFMPPPRSAPVGADLAQWLITLDNGHQQHTVTFCEDGSAATAPWQSLVAQLRASA